MGVSVYAEREVWLRLDECVVSTQDLHKVRYEADAWIFRITDEQLRLSILTIFLFFKTQADAADVVRRCNSCCDRQEFVGYCLALDVTDCECVGVTKSVSMVGAGF